MSEAVLPDELISSARAGHLKKVVKWLRKGDVNARSCAASGSNTLLHSAVCMRQADLVRELLRRGAAVDLANDNGSTPLMAAAWKGELETVQLFLSSGADVNRQTVKGVTVGQRAAIHIQRASAGRGDVRCRRGGGVAAARS